MNFYSETVKEYIAKDAIDVVTNFDTIKVRIPHETLAFCAKITKDREVVDSTVRLVLLEKGFNAARQIDVEEDLFDTIYTQKVTGSFDMPKPTELINQICDKYEITTEMGRVALEQALKNLSLFDKKQRDYGSGNISDFGEIGVLIRLNDKINRLKNLLKSQASVNFESVADTWDDIANYGLIGKLCHLKLWK
jgi:hypothetical protein